MSLPCVVPLRLSCSFWSFMDCPIFELVVGHWHWPLVQVCLCPCCHVSSLCRDDLWGLQADPIWPFQKGQMEAGLSIGLTPAQTIWRIVLPQAFRVALQIWQLPSWTSCAMLLWLIPLALSISWEQATWSVNTNLGNYSLETYSCRSDLLGNCPVISFSAQLLEKRLSVTER